MAEKLAEEEKISIVLRYVGKPAQMFPDLDYCNTLGSEMFAQGGLFME